MNVNGLFDQEKGSSYHLISYGHFQLKAKSRKKIDGGQSNYFLWYMPSHLIPLVLEEEGCEEEDDTD